MEEAVGSGQTSLRRRGVGGGVSSFSVFAFAGIRQIEAQEGTQWKRIESKAGSGPSVAARRGSLAAAPFTFLQALQIMTENNPLEQLKAEAASAVAASGAGTGQKIMAVVIAYGSALVECEERRALDRCRAMQSRFGDQVNEYFARRIAHDAHVARQRQSRLLAAAAAQPRFGWLKPTVFLIVATLVPGEVEGADVTPLSLLSVARPMKHNLLSIKRQSEALCAGKIGMRVGLIAFHHVGVRPVAVGGPVFRVKPKSPRCIGNQLVIVTGQTIGHDPVVIGFGIVGPEPNRFAVVGNALSTSPLSLYASPRSQYARIVAPELDGFAVVGNCLVKFIARTIVDVAPLAVRLGGVGPEPDKLRANGEGVVAFAFLAERILPP